MKFRHFIQHILIASVFTSLWWPDLMWLGWIFHSTHPIESSGLHVTTMWRKVRFQHFIQHVAFVSVFKSTWWPDLIWLGPTFQPTGAIQPCKLMRMWRKIQFWRCIGHFVYWTLRAKINCTQDHEICAVNRAGICKACGREPDEQFTWNRPL